ncbi:MAG: DUF4349 domain-containing protein [Chloroflexia bacterium]
MSQIARTPVRPACSLILVCLGLLVALTACGGAAPTATTRRASSAPSAAASVASYAPAAAASAAPAAASSAGGTGTLATSVPGRSSLPVSSSAPVAVASAAPKSSAAPGLTPPQYIPIANVGRRLIKSGTVSMVVQDVDASFEEALKIAQANGGDILQYTNTKDNDRRVADLILQVDSGKFEASMQALRKMAGIIERKVDKADVQEVTEEVVDVQAQIASLELSLQQLDELQKRTTRTDEILAIQREINNVRAQIDKLKTRGAQLEQQTDQSTITLHLESGKLPVASEPPTPTVWDPSSIAGRAWSASLAILQGVGTVVITVAVFCWWLLPLLPIAWIVYRRYRRPNPVRTVAAPPAPPVPPAAAAGD